jgi:hypothetical protein
MPAKKIESTEERKKERRNELSLLADRKTVENIRVAKTKHFIINT